MCRLQNTSNERKQFSLREALIAFTGVCVALILIPRPDLQLTENSWLVPSAAGWLLLGGSLGYFAGRIVSPDTRAAYTFFVGIVALLVLQWLVSGLLLLTNLI